MHAAPSAARPASTTSPITTVEGSHGGAPSPPASPAESRPNTFVVARAEMVPTIKTPEVVARPVELSAETHRALVDTVAYHLEMIHKLAQEKTPYRFPPDSLQEMFYAEFRRRFPDADLSSPEQLRTAAEEFLTKGGAEVRLALKMAEWEAATIQAACGRMWVAKSRAPFIQLANEAKGTTRYIWGPKGFQKIDRPPSVVAKFLGIDITHIKEYEFTGGENMNLAGNTLLSPEQIKFMETCGWSTTSLNDAQRAVIDDRLVAITALRSDIYLQTGAKAKDIESEFNFIRVTAGKREYLSAKKARLLGEGATGTNVGAILAEEGKNIAQEVKKKVEAEIEKVKKQAQERKAQRTVDQLRRRMAEIQESASLSEPEREIMITEINAEIQKLKQRLILFSRQRLLKGEIPTATKARDEAKTRVEDRQKTMIVAGEATVDLLIWSGDISIAESQAATQAEIFALEKLREPIDEEIRRLEREIDKAYARKPSVEGLEVDEYEDTTARGTKRKGKKVPSRQRTENFEKWEKKLEGLEKKLDDKLKELNENLSQDGGKETLSGKLAKLKAKHARRKAVLDDVPIKTLLDEYHEAEKVLQEKEEEAKKAAAEIATLTSSITPPVGKTAEEVAEENIKQAIKNQEDARRALEAGGLTGENKLEVEALTALTAVYPPESQSAREGRIKDAEQRIIGAPEFGPQWKAFPPAILRCIQLIWGDEVLEAQPPDPELADRVLALMGSQSYLGVVIEAIESTPITGVTIATLANKTAATAEGSYTNLADVFVSGGVDATIKTLTYDKISRDVIEKIVAEMRKKALNITTIP